METGRQVQKTTIKDMLCCCLPKRGLQQDAQERDGLLTQQRAVEMRVNRQ